MINGNGGDDFSFSTGDIIPVVVPSHHGESENTRMKNDDDFKDDNTNECDLKDDVYLESFRQSQASLEMKGRQSI